MRHMVRHETEHLSNIKAANANFLYLTSINKKVGIKWSLQNQQSEQLLVEAVTTAYYNVAQLGNIMLRLDNN